MKHVRMVLAVLAVIDTSALQAYEPPVHKAMTVEAFAAVRTDLVPRLGVNRTDRIAGALPVTWMRDGAVNEDRIVPDMRSLQHFFDPEHLTGLRVACAPVGTRADGWATDAGPFNTYDIVDAKQHYQSAVVGLSPEVRTASLRDLFVTLGHVVHLVQDMAQPEHTRNDQHLPGTQVMFQNGTGASVWEVWGGKHLVDVTVAPVSFGGYPQVEHYSYLRYFHTDDTRDGRRAGKGMADYSNLNFVTQDTNYHDEDPSWSCPVGVPTSTKCFFLTEPKIGEAARRTTTSHYAVVIDGATEVVEVEEDIFTSFAVDNYLGRTDADPFHTFLSSLDIETGQFACDRIYSLGDGSYLSRAALLVPRAVGYSAGLIERFFRGSVEATWKKTAPGIYELKLANRSPEWLGHDAVIEAYYRPTPGYLGSTPGDLAPILVGSIKNFVPAFNGLHPGQSVTIPNVSPIALKAGDDLMKFERRIVVKGTLGTEPGAVIGLVQPAPEPLVADVTISCAAVRKTYGVWQYDESGRRPPNHLRLTVPSGSTTVCSDPAIADHVPDTCIEKLPTVGGTDTARVTINSFDAKKRYVFSAAGNSMFSTDDWLPSCFMEWRVTVGGKVVKTMTWSGAGYPVYAASNALIYP